VIVVLTEIPAMLNPTSKSIGRKHISAMVCDGIISRIEAGGRSILRHFRRAKNGKRTADAKKLR
jgi:hypothetical protein